MDAVSALVTHAKGLVLGSEGQDLIEYGLLVALIAVVAIFAVSTVGTAVNSLFWQTFASAI